MASSRRFHGSQMMSSIDPMDKQLVTEESRPYRIGCVQFGMLSGADMTRMAEMEVVNTQLNDQEGNPSKNGVLDTRLGVCNTKKKCATCDKYLKDCIGHYGHVKFELPVYHIGFFDTTIKVLQRICKTCSRVLIDDKDKRQQRYKLLEKLQRVAGSCKPVLSRREKNLLLKVILDRCKQVKKCPWCGAFNGALKKAVGTGGLRIIHDRYKDNRSANETKSMWHAEFEEAIKHQPEVGQHLDKAVDDITPARALELFRNIPDCDLPLLGCHPVLARPENLLLTNILVPPVCIRPSVSMPGGCSNEDPLTTGLRSAIQANNQLRIHLHSGAKTEYVVNSWDHLGVVVTHYINGKLPNSVVIRDPRRKKSLEKHVRGLVPRLKGKAGRFRQHLSGKRVNFSARTVISPDPNLDIDEVGVPIKIAKMMTYPVRVTSKNLIPLQRLVKNGMMKYPGANFVYTFKKDQLQKWCLNKNTKNVARYLKVGDIVERHLINGDWVLFNRQPSLHRMSIMSHRARVLPWRTFRFNECVCSPYNADFDGDEMNLHVPQTEEARAEAACLMSVTNNLVTPKNGAPLVSACQDFLTAAFLLTQRDTFFTKEQFCELCCYVGDAAEEVKLPPPCILKPVRLWTGKQVIRVLLCPKGTHHPSSAVVNMSLRIGKTYVMPEDRGATDDKAPCMCPKDGYVIIHNSELVCGNLDKTALGANKKGLIMLLIRDHSSELARWFMRRLTKCVTRWLTNHGMTIGLDDVTASPALREHMQTVFDGAFEGANSKIKLWQEGKLPLRPGCDEIGTLEAEVQGIMDNVRKDMAVMSFLPRHNMPGIMATCGAKGSSLNICQMVACTGQQIVNGKRPPEGFLKRTLPHFSLQEARDPAAKGFVANSFYSGLNGPEFFFHTMGGREGLVDTSVKTATTGYMQRRLMKALEDLCLQYDNTVRSACKDVVQFQFGDDRLNPSFMEDNGRPVDFKRLLAVIRAEEQGRLGGKSSANTRTTPSARTPTTPLTATNDGIVRNRGARNMICHQFAKKGKCSYGFKCRFMHAPQEQKHTNSGGGVPSVYAHTNQTRAEPYLTADQVRRHAKTFLDSRKVNAIQPSFAREKFKQEAHESLEGLAKDLDSHQPWASGDGEDDAPRKRARNTPLPKTNAAKLAEVGKRVADMQAKWRQQCKDGEAMAMDLTHGTGAASPPMMSMYEAAEEWRDRCDRGDKQALEEERELINQHTRGVTAGMLRELCDRAFKKYSLALLQPGEACGAVAAQSLGEPATQMTLKTFHFAGVASMNVTMGVPRVQEIFDATNDISTPIISAQLAEKFSRNETSARIIKARVEKTTLGEVAQYIRESFSQEHGACLEVRLNLKKIRKLHLKVTVDSVIAALDGARKLKPRVQKKDLHAISDRDILVYPPKMRKKQQSQSSQVYGKRGMEFFAIQELKLLLPNVIVCGIPSIERVVIQRDEKDENLFFLAAEGLGMLQVMGKVGIDHTRTTSNHIIEVYKTLGIEAARAKIIEEVHKIYDSYGIKVDVRHLMILADTMTYRGEVLGMTRFGIAKMKDSVFLLASFEKTSDHLFDAAAAGRSDYIEGVSECVITGVPMPVGTGTPQLLRPAPPKPRLRPPQWPPILDQEIL